MVWSEWGQGVHSAWVRECGKVAAARADLSPPFGGKPALRTPHQCSLGFSSLSMCPSCSPGSRRVLPPLYKTPGLECPVCLSTCSLPRVSVHLYDLPFPLSSLPGAQVSTPGAFLPILPGMGLWGNLSCSLGCIGVLLPVST